jgi:FAD-dependent urate hydroxylase
MTSKRPIACDVAVVGAGPYGLSVAAHLKQAGVPTRMFGDPMQFWQQHMPKGMKLRSPWRATHLSSPDGRLSLDRYAAQAGTERDRALPLEEFIAYGNWFQEHAVPDPDRRAVRRVEGAGNGFHLELSDGEIVEADRVVIATGLANQDYRPPAFRRLDTARVTHTCEHADFSPLRGKRVAVIGRGQSACESAALLAEAGADVELFSRGEIHWLGASTVETMTRKTMLQRLRDGLAAPSAVGPLPLSWLAELPALLNHLPPGLRDRFTARCLKAGAAGWLKPRFDQVRCHNGRAITAVRALPDRIMIEFDDGASSFDHVVLGTGYQIDISRIGILSPLLLSRIACSEGSPVLGSGFETNVPKLHFVGAYAVKSFGPLLRFIAGAPFAARSVCAAAQGRNAAATAAEFPGAMARLPGRASPNLPARP